MLSSDNKTYITIVHRLIEVTYDGEGNPLYTFRGDANPKSMSGEFQISKDKIIGVYETDGYKGTKNLALGYAICYLQSNIGIIILVITFMLLLIYSILVEKLFVIYDQRYNELLVIKLGQIMDEINIEEKTSNIDETELEINENASEEEIKDKIEKIAKENHINKENMMVKKGRIYYRDQYGRFISLSNYLKLQKEGFIKKSKAKESIKTKSVTPKNIDNSRPRDEFGRYIKIEESQKTQTIKDKVGVK